MFWSWFDFPINYNVKSLDLGSQALRAAIAEKIFTGYIGLQLTDGYRNVFV